MLAQERLLTEMGGGVPNDTILSVDENRTRILVLCKDIGGVDFLQFKSDLDDFIQSRNSDNRFEWRVTGDGMLASIGIDKLINDLLSSVGLVFVVILLVFAWMLRSTPHVLLAFIPNVLPLLMTLALLSLMGRDLQVSNIVSFTVAIGLAVDDTIHFVARYREERLGGYPHPVAMQRTMLGAGHAIVLTSILLICGFGLLATSELTSTFYFGILTAITLVSAIFADLLLLPAMFNWWESRES
jgi:predicted RND superfamily exporter protein